MTGTEGQTLAGVILASGTLVWGTAAPSSAVRGVFCGIGVCFGCLVTVNGHENVRACQRRARSGDDVRLGDTVAGDASRAGGSRG